MPRRQRAGSGGLIFHVMNRSAKRVRLFETPMDYHSFEKLLFQTRKQQQIPLLAYCLMPNHWHLIVWPVNDGDLSRFMHYLTGTHAQRWNVQRQLSGFGAVYQGRFKAVAIQSDSHYLRACRYVEQNPLRAGLVGAVSEWRWSSFWRRLNFCDEGVLSEWPVPRPEDWADLVRDVPDSDVAAIRTAIRRSLPFGSEGWCAETASRLGLQASLNKRGRPKFTQVEEIDQNGV
jgi:putative transposase